MRKLLVWNYKLSIYIWQNELVDNGICAASKAKTVVEEFMIPLVGERQRIYEQTLESMEVTFSFLFEEIRNLHNTVTVTLSQIRHFFQSKSTDIVLVF